MKATMYLFTCVNQNNLTAIKLINKTMNVKQSRHDNSQKRLTLHRGLQSL